MRLDKYISLHNQSLSRTKVKSVIEGGFVKVAGTKIDKPSFYVEDDLPYTDVEITGMPDSLGFVSRGGLKLDAALEQFNIDVSGMKACDIGASTGGFTDCFLKRGAAAVYSIDSGHGQLHESLKNDSRITSIEGFNARNLSPDDIGGLCDIAAADVSFISQTYIIPSSSQILCDGGTYIGLIKPQFEAGKKYIGKNGIVKDKKAYIFAITVVIESAETHGLLCVGLMDSPIVGGGGNREFLIICEKREIDETERIFNRNKIKEFINDENCRNFPQS